MIKTQILKLNHLKIIVLALAAIILSFFVVTSAFSQSPTQSASPSPAPTTGGGVLDLQFPVEDLGGCKDLKECTNYCEDPVNQNSCTSFAKKNGFYQDDQTTYGDDEFWTDAEGVLGCNSHEACFDFCSQSANFDICESYAKSNEIPGGYVQEPDKPEFLETAKTVLGCDSAETCTNFCSDQANADKCGSFADQVGLLGGTVQEGPGGCQSGETCSAFCSDPANYGQCSEFAPSGGNFAGPGGCTSEESCRSYCDQNPESCRSYAPGSNGFYVPMVCSAGETHGPGGACTAISDIRPAVECISGSQYWNGSTCQANPPVGISTEVPSGHFEPRPEMDNCTTPGECYDYCTANPGTCEGFDATASRPTDSYTPYLYYTPGTEVTNEPIESMGGCTSPAGCYDYCRNNPGECEGFTSRAPRPPEIYIPSTYYTPPTDAEYSTPPTTNFYTTPIYYTPPEGSNYTTPQYYTPGMYSTPSYQTPPVGSNYTTPNYYTPWSNYATPTGEYPTPTYASPSYYTPPIGSNYTTPYYYTPPQYTTPYYYTPGQGGIASNYTTPTYSTPPPYTTPQYYTPYTGINYTTPVYYTPPTYTTPYYYTPPAGTLYTTPTYYTPPARYTTPQYYTPGTYPTPPQYTTPPPYTSPSTSNCPSGATCSYFTPSPYTTPTYPSPPNSGPYYYPTPGSPYSTPSYPYPSPSSPYYYPTPGTSYPTPDSGSYPYPSPSGPYYYPSPGGPYEYPTPSNTSYPTPSTDYPSPYYTPGSGYTSPPSYASPPSYGTPSYGTPSYGTPSYGTPSYGTPSYGTPSYNTPSYNTPSYNSPSDYPTPPVQGVAIYEPGVLQNIWGFLIGR